MSDARAADDRRETRRADGSSSGRGRGSDELFAALDLGTNNCRLLVAAPTREGFRVVDAFSRIVRLGEGLTQTGRLQPAAMDRALAALKICADRIQKRGTPHVRAIATQACRSAENGPEFLDRVARETGLRLRIIPPREEARLSVAGCLNLLDRQTDAALVVDVGGGSTELSWVDLREPGAKAAGIMPPIRAWLSIPIGVVTLAERFPEQRPGEANWFRAMVEAVKEPVIAFPHAEPLREIFQAGRGHLVGTSGAITSLAGIHLGLARYDRARVDGLWLSRDQCDATADQLLDMHPDHRAAQPCIGKDRADLVLCGAAILRAIQELWPCPRVRVADRGLREGILLSLMAERNQRRPRRRRRGRPVGRVEAAA
ncbi:MAG TPA: Ppx/GppA phosphatase family protein [Caulobacteraceae bacterium]|jgi:exopolyphosphatase/guanosine-5'-triphosphate,3'-diphosphate pyrophosphatase|nr:Ppx/GppA phosphatase family protein [Caulobacteraceae bacterium]